MTNRLSQSFSPYLQQHAQNPVHWHAWSDEPFLEAKLSNKLILISIGYSSCHWCHVMEHESFSNAELAETMNSNLVCIKVDREEFPDVDHHYLNVLQKMGIQGGWPLNVFLLPNGNPVYGGTYFKPAQWKSIVTQLAQIWSENPLHMQTVANELAVGLQDQSNSLDKIIQNVDYNELCSFVDKFCNALLDDYDAEKGGLKGAPKFIMPGMWTTALAIADIRKNEAILQFVKYTLHQISLGGIRDHLGGGFARYSTDAQWHVPHFEKMLYDNAQLMSLYSKAFSKLSELKYLDVLDDLNMFIDNDLTSDQIGKYAALDADTEGQEGLYYVWTLEEAEKILGSDCVWFSAIYGITQPANWEIGNVLHKSNKWQDIMELHAVGMEQLQQARMTLLEYRGMRAAKPFLDYKILTSWNAMMVSAYLDFFHHVGHPRALQQARKLMDYLLENGVAPTGYLKHIVNKHGDIDVIYLDDYAFTIEALIKLYLSTSEEFYILKAMGLAQVVVQTMGAGTMYPMAHYLRKPPVETTGFEWIDQVWPSSNAVMAHNFFRLSELFHHAEMGLLAQRMLSQVIHQKGVSILYLYRWVNLAIEIPYQQILVLSGPQANLEYEYFRQFNFPFLTVLLAQSGSALPILENRPTNQLTWAICRGKVCLPPFSSRQETLKAICDYLPTVEK